jgi:hypothetical protein
MPKILFKSVLILALVSPSCSVVEIGVENISSAAENIREDNSPELSKELAVEDLKCPNEQVSLKLLPLRPARCGYNTREIYEASGCGKTALYSCYSDRNSVEHCSIFSKDELTVKDGEPCNSDPSVHPPRSERLGQ